MLPKIWAQTSLEAWIFRAILIVHSCGTWQSEHFARTPDRLVKWMVCFNSGYRNASWLWQLVQKVSVFVNSSAVLNAPQNAMPQTKPPTVRKPRLKCTLGRLMIFQ